MLIITCQTSLWCGKYLQGTTGSNDESKDEYNSILPSKIIFDALSFSSSLISVLADSHSLKEDVLLIVRSFITELLNLSKASIMENEKIHSVASEVLKVAQVVLDAVIKLCRAFFQSLKLDYYNLNNYRNRKDINDEELDFASQAVRITAYTIETLYELGIYAASGGGSRVTVLNLSWKGVVSLLQLGKGVLTEKVNVGDIISTLLSLVIESLSCAAESWSALQESLNISVAKRTFLPIKFFLINAVRISSEYPTEALTRYRNITHCTLVISSLVILFSKEPQLRTASEALAELLEPSSFLLLHTLLNSSESRHESKFQILEMLFINKEESDSAHMEEDASAVKSASLDIIFNLNSDATLRSGALLPGQVILYLNLLKTSSALRETVVIDLSRKLDTLMNMLAQEDVYSSILGLQIPVLCSAGSLSLGIVWQPIYTFVIQALKTFMIVAASSSVAWIEMETFLLQNLLHPHFLCLEIITELWCFFMRHAEIDTKNHIVDKLFFLLKMMASSKEAVTHLADLRKIARPLCIILSYAAPSTVDRVYNSILCDGKSYASSVIYLTLLMEEFPFESLSANTKTIAIRKICTAFNDFVESYSKELGVNGFPGTCSFGLLGFPVHVLASALRYCHLKDSDIVDDKTVSLVFKFTCYLIKQYRCSADSMKDHLAKLISAMLDIISNMKHLYGSNEMEKIILRVHTLFVQDSADANSFLHQCKPSLASFMTGVSHMEITEGEGGLLCSSIWDLYHVLLRERHWAFIHVAITAFGYFAARTSCTQLWRFVPDDAALSYDMDTGKMTDENRFMSELKGFLEKEVALHVVTLSREQLCLLVNEGTVLKKLAVRRRTVPQASVPEEMDISEESSVQKKKRKLPDGICEGVMLLQNGLKVMRDAINQADSAELQHEFSSHIICLEDVISHIVGLSGTV
ncbi:uncharacterized protein [Typha latifolia]|uniref:uncharacterized protein isoform X1 n=2 Tax=Typha latifolia TaxID=4733 RepID=UPI003C2F7DF2